jgi:enoyl-CoA hydratase
MTEGIRIAMGIDDVLEIVLDRAADGNVLTHAMGDAIEKALAALPDSTKAVLMRSEGADFCAGRQSPMPPAGTRATAADLKRRVGDPVLAFYAAIRESPVPVLAAVRGRAAGVGCALAGLADLAVAADDAVFSIPEMERDIPPLLVMTALADRLPRAALARLVLSRDRIGAAEAVAIGLVGAVVPRDRLDAEIARLRAGLAKNSPTVLRAVKAFLNAAPEMSWAARRELAAAANATAVSERFRD